MEAARLLEGEGPVPEPPQRRESAPLANGGGAASSGEPGVRADLDPPCVSGGRGCPGGGRSGERNSQADLGPTPPLEAVAGVRGGGGPGGGASSSGERARPADFGAFRALGHAMAEVGPFVFCRRCACFSEGHKQVRNLRSVCKGLA